MEVPLKHDISEYELDYQIGFRLRIAMQRHAEIFFSKMDLGLTQPQYATMVRLFQIGRCSQNELGRSVGLDSANIAGVVNRLKAQGYIDSVRDNNDRRRISLRLTVEGKTLIEKAIRLAIEANEATLRNLDQSEREMLLHLLRKLVKDESDRKEESDRPA